VRKMPPNGKVMLLSGADPLNLHGIVTPGERVPYADVLAYRDGACIAHGPLGEVRSVLGESIGLPGAPTKRVRA
jgi:ATP-dependent helicase Lhr and Lhr-like helicase